MLSSVTSPSYLFFLKYFIYYYCVCISASEHAAAWVWRSEGRFGVLVLSFHVGEKSVFSSCLSSLPPSLIMYSYLAFVEQTGLKLSM